MVALGVAVALRLRKLTGDAAVIVLIPPAFGVFGGVHVHFQQLAIAFPAILYVYARYPQVRALAAGGLGAGDDPVERDELDAARGLVAAARRHVRRG